MYKTVSCKASAEFVERKSRFIGYVCPVKTKSEADDFVESIRALHRTATHNVYAYVLRENNFQRYSDDGEPGGTAGVPVLNVLLKQELTDTAVVVTRYFGGILLGAGGLVRAYGAAAGEAVKKSGIAVMKECSVCSIMCDYGRYGKIETLLGNTKAVIKSTDFTDQVNIIFYLESEKLSALRKELSELSAGQLELEVKGEDFLPIPQDIV